MRTIVRKIYHKLFPIVIRNKIYLLYAFFFDKENYYVAHKYRKYKTSYGKNNRDKCFFVIHLCPYRTGLLSFYLTALGHLIENDKKILQGKLIPVMDMYTEYNPLSHNDESDVMRINAWEMYFEQFSEYSMQEVLNSKHVLYSGSYVVDSALAFYHDNKFDTDTVRKYLEVHNRFFHLRQDLAEKYNETVKTLLGNKRVLGTNIREGYMVLANGRDNKEKSYNGQYIEGHPKQPNIEELCNLLEQKKAEWDCDYIYAECETEYVENILRKRFGERFICSSRKRRKVSDLSLDSWNKACPDFMNNYGRYQNNVSYLESIYLLSRCTSLYAGKSSGTVVACFWNNDKYEHLEIINKGVY